jgi:hypothetical protein
MRGPPDGVGVPAAVRVDHNDVRCGLATGAERGETLRRSVRQGDVNAGPSKRLADIEYASAG